MGAIDSTSLPLRRHRLSVAQFERMGEAGIFAREDRVELIDGELIAMAPIGTRHASAVMRLNRIFTAAFGGERAVVSVQSPLFVSDFSEPQPDLMLLRPRDDIYAAAHPRPSDVLLLVEVSDTTSRYDRVIKLPLYARAGIAEVWIVDLDNDVLRIHRRPSGETYAETEEIVAPAAVTVAAFPETTIDLTGLL